MCGMAEDHTGGMIALIPRAEDASKLVVAGGAPAEEMHLTLTYLGDDVTGWTARQKAEATAAAGYCAIDLPPVQTRVMGHGVFNPDGYEDREPCAVYLIGDCRVLGPMRSLLTQYSAAEQHEPFHAHVTAGFGVPFTRLSYVGDVVFDRLRVAIADQVMDFPLGDTEEIKRMVTEAETKGKLPPQFAAKKKKPNGQAKDKGGTADAGINNIGDLAKAVKTYKAAKAEAQAEMWPKLKAAAKKLNAPKMIAGLEAPKGGGGDEKKDLDLDIFEAAWLELKVASPDPRAAKLREYWAHDPKGRAKWKPGVPGDFNRLVRQLRKYVKNPKTLKGLAANIHHLALGAWPGREGNKDVLDWLDSGAEVETKDSIENPEAFLAQMRAVQRQLKAAMGEDDETEGGIDSDTALDADYDGGLGEEEALEQALADDVTWDLNPDGSLDAEPDADENGSGQDVAPDADADDVDEDGSLAKLFALAQQATGAARDQG
jgi:hypothetical protein